ncbi:pro-adrenomedullin-like isoform X2 [Cebidichthys violaceus]
MRLALQTVLCCCVVLTAVLPLVKGAAGELNTGLKKRFKVWLQSRVKRDLCSGSATANERHSDVTAGPRRDEVAKSVSPPPSGGQPVRSKRSTSNKSSGCKFVTCVYHDLLHRLHQINEPKSCAPGSKMGSKGYGRRRRRSLPDAAQLSALRTGSTEAGQRVRRHNSTRTVA